VSAPQSAWILSDGKQGHLSPMIGVTEALGIAYEIKNVPRLRPIDHLSNSIMALLRRPAIHLPLTPPYPELCIASGRRTVRYLRSVKKASPETFCVYFMDPRSARSGADVVVAQHHDGLSGGNVVQILTAPHRFSEERLSRACQDARAELAALPRPRIAVLIGGDSRHHRFRREDVARLSTAIEDLARTGAGLMITLSRRTPPSLAQAIGRIASRENVFLWDGSGENPITEFFALADDIVVTGDSISMMGEAAGTGRPIHIFSPSGGHPKFDRFQQALASVATLAPFPGPMGGDPYPRVDSTQFVADTIRVQYQRRLANGLESG
jgi:hypothetical protein